MTTLFRCSAVIALLAAGIGCEQSTVQGENGRKLSVVQPSSQTMNRGDTNKIDISVSRTNFGDALGVTFSDLPRGTTVVEDKKIASDRSSGTYTLHSAPDADLVTNHVSRVTVEGPGGMTATETFKITVNDRK